MKAVVFLACLAVAVSAIEFQSLPGNKLLGLEPMQVPVMETVAADFSKLAASLKTELSKQAVTALSVPTTLAVGATCQAAVDALAGVYVSGACQNVPEFNPQGAGVTQESMTAFCTSDCTVNIKAKVDDVAAKCTGADASIFVDSNFAIELRKASNIINTVCTKDGDKYCFVALQNSQNSLTLTKEKLDEICTPCTQKIIIASATYGDRSAQQAAVYLDLLCMKRGSPLEYCIPKLQSMQTALAASQQTGDFSALCHPCVPALFGKMIELSQSFSDDQSTVAMGAAYAKLGATLRAACQKKDGEFCINVIFRASQQIQASAAGADCPDEPDATKPCSDNCKGFVNQMQGVMGCCLSGFLAMNSEGGNVALWLSSSCGITIGGSCSTQVVKAVFRITNLRFAYYTANKAAVEAKLKADLALFAGVTADDVTIESISEIQANAAASTGLVLFAGAGLDVKYTVTPSDEAQAAQIKEQILSGAAVALPNTASLPLDSREQPTAAIGVDVTKSTADTASAGGAAALKASFAAVLLAAAVALFAARQ